MRTSPKPLAVTAVLIALSSAPSTGQTAFFVEDLAPGTASSGPSDFAELNGITLFAASDSTNGRELWRTDGTPAGTQMVRNIRPGVASSSPQDLVRLGSFVYFRANDGSTGVELWRSDGSVGGTVRVKDILPGASSSLPDGLVELGGFLYFEAEGPGTGRELWRTDGTDAGTVLVADLWPGPDSGSPSDITRIGSTLYFAADDGVDGSELWKYDTLGAAKILDIEPGADGSFPSRFVEASGTVFFYAYQLATNRELWATDGTPSGTVMLKDIQPGGGPSMPGEMVSHLGRVFFTAAPFASGRELWTSDGTPAGTVMVKEIGPGALGGLDSTAYLHSFGPLLYFAADDSVNGRELWASDGTPAGTQMVVDLHAGGSSSPSAITDWNGVLVFAADDGTSGAELWTSDGTPGGTALLQDLDPGAGSSSPAVFTPYLADLLFDATLPATGNELWILKAAPLDFGDAPASYGTLLAADGARHPVVAGFQLGAAVDFDFDGQPDSGASLDDIDNPVDDEDGVVFTSPVEIGAMATVEVTASAPGLLNAWVDFDLDGVFQHPGEQIFADEPLAAGVNPLSFFVPQVTPGFTFARFRFDSVGGLGPTGAATDGEVEDHALDLVDLTVFDFGDAPASYGTLLAADGARHAIGGPFLGGAPDDEPDGQPSAGADGDDTNGSDDEDGVFFPNKLVQGASTTYRIDAACGAEIGGCTPLVDAWIDFGADGAWDEPGDRVLSSQALVEGTNVLTVDVPAAAVLGPTYARFRISLGGGLAAGGAADDGEVEDLRIEIFESPIFVDGGFEDGTFSGWSLVVQ